MARKSRVKLTETVESTTVSKVYNTAAYIRKSTNDEESVENQADIVQSYIENQPDLKLRETYIDNGFSGVNFDREAFNRMLSDIKDRKIDCVVVKDLSRFGRDYIVGGELIEMLLPKWGVRFVAINDKYDSIDITTADILTMHIKNVMNQIYSYDLGKKITSVLHEKQKQGLFIGNNAPYGYLKSPTEKGKLVVNPETAPIVREIYRMRLSGMSYLGIARELTHRGILTPSAYEKTKGAANTWNPEGICKILQNQVYLGHMIQRKRCSLFLKGGKKHNQLPKEEWIIVENTHEPIIDQQTFDAVQRYNTSMNDKYSAAKKAKKNHDSNKKAIFRGVVSCGQCGARLIMTSKTAKSKQKTYIYYCCSTHHYFPERCSSRLISEEELSKVVFKAIQMQIQIAQEIKMHINSSRFRQDTAAKKKTTANEIKRLEGKLEKIALYKELLYMDYVDELINKEEYLYAQKRYNEQQIQLESILQELIETEQNRVTEEKICLKTFLDYQDETLLTRKMIEALVEKIIVYSKTEVEVQFRFNDALTKIQNELQAIDKVDKDD